MLLDINSLQHTRRSSTNEENIVPGANPKSFLITLPRSSVQHEWQTQPFSLCLDGGELNTSALMIKTPLFQTDLSS